MSSVMPVSRAWRMVDCCENWYPAASSVPLPYHAPHSSTTSFDVMVRAGVADGGPVVRNDALHDAGAGQQIVEIAVVELERVAFSKLTRAAGRVVVHGESPQMAVLGVGGKGFGEAR